MNSETLHSRQRRLREAAILVDSLDGQLAKRLMASMPAADSAAVLKAMNQLGSVDPEERNKIVTKFRRSTEAQHPTQVDGVELDASLLARFENQNGENQNGANQDVHKSDSENVVAKISLETLDPEETATVVGMLSAEHPQTISIVLSRLSPTNAADLLSKFSPILQADVLTRMANSDFTDEQAVGVIESQLGLWIDQHRQQRRRMAAGLDLVQKIFSSTSETQRKNVLTQLRGSDPALAGRLASEPKPSRSTKDETSPPDENSSSNLLKLGSAAKSDLHFERDVFAVDRVKEGDSRPRETAPTKVPHRIPARPAEELDRLDDATLIAALSQSDRKVVTLALAGASEALMKRVLRGLPRRHAGILRSQLRDIGPTRLSDMLAAQQELLNSAHQLTIKQ